jgi:two-component system chemotaxis sensor kinase CheA
VSLSAKIREQLISSFRAELAEHVQTMTDGLLALEQGAVSGEGRQSTLERIFRAAHSLKGAARAMGVTTIEQLAHALEDLLEALECAAVGPTPELFTVCYQALDAIQVVQAAYESGETTPPVQALQALNSLAAFRSDRSGAASQRNGEAASQQAHDENGAEALGPQTPPAEASTPEPVIFRAEETETARSTQYAARGDEETIRVGVSKLDALMAQLSELLVIKIRAEQRLAQVRQAQELMSLWQKEWLAFRSTYNRLARRSQGLPSVERNWSKGNASGPSRGLPLAESRDDNDQTEWGKDASRLLVYVGASQERLREMNALMNDLSREYANDTMHMSLMIDALEQEIKRVRMLPLSTITRTFGRMVRDLAQAAGKEATLQIVGADTELDKRVLEQIKDPLMHLLRNAIDHGIEPPEKRVALGKPRSGTITLTAEQLGKDVVLTVSDDGAGLDIEAIRRAVARQGRVDPQALNEAELAELIFNAGVSTSPIITDVSGRGVGLDVVRRNLEELHGRIDVDWTPDAGATFTLTLPLALTSSRGLLVRVSDQLFAIPLNNIEHILYVRPQQVSSLEGQDTLRYNGRPVTLVQLGDVLELPRLDVQRDDPRLLVVVLAAAERRMAFAVDGLAGEQEVVIKGLGKQLSRVGGIAGATVLGSGEVVLILNVADLIKLALRGERRSVLDAPAETVSRQRILIVDDSVTTRTLEKNILEAAGYTVQLATDGQEALAAIAAGGVPDLVVSDIVMPRLDGFDLTRRLKNDPQTAPVPVILVTSLGSPEDKAHGIEVGADAYIVKSSFDQNNLLETIEQLI